MIVSFSVANYRSFLGEQTFSLVASKKLGGTHDDHATPIPDSSEKVLKAAVIYGANAAGKSNLFKAVSFLKRIATRTRGKSAGTGREAFRFTKLGSAPSSFDLQFIAADKLFRFGCKVDDEKVVEEWLAQVIGGKERVIYERVTDNNGNVTIEAPGFRQLGEKIKALATIGGPANQSFLATINATLQEADVGPEITVISKWFRSYLQLIAPDAMFRTLSQKLTTEADFLRFSSDFLRAASTGVDELTISRTPITEDEIRALLPKPIADDVLKDLSDSAGTLVVQGPGKEIAIEKTDTKDLYRVSVQAQHSQGDGKKTPLELDEESDGTQRLLNLIPALHRLRTKGAIYFIDEIDRSMHPNLVWHFLEFFLRSCSGVQRQVIVTTHESNLLDLDLLRRDEIWFAEKDSNSATQLYSLVDFKVRKDLEIRKHYLQGRFGAIPYLGDLERLIEKQAA